MAVVGARPVGGLGALRRPRPRARSASRAAPRRRGGRRTRAPLRISTLVVGIAVAACLALFYLSQSIAVSATGYVIGDLQQRLAERRAEQQQLLVQISESRSPAAIEERALRRLNLQPIDHDRITFAVPSTDDGD